jgi:hypothetical protein
MKMAKEGVLIASAAGSKEVDESFIVNVELLGKVMGGV